MKPRSTTLLSAGPTNVRPCPRWWSQWSLVMISGMAAYLATNPTLSTRTWWWDVHDHASCSHQVISTIVSPGIRTLSSRGLSVVSSVGGYVSVSVTIESLKGRTNCFLFVCRLLLLFCPFPLAREAWNCWRGSLEVTHLSSVSDEVVSVLFALTCRSSYRHVILHLSAKFRSNQTIVGGVMTSYPFFQDGRRQPYWI